MLNKATRHIPFKGLIHSLYLLAAVVPALAWSAHTPGAVHDNAPTLPHYAQEKHLGVATCANSMCHGVRMLNEPSNVRQNEYHTWLLNDRHAGAYKTLLNEQSKSIAKKLGLANAATADICLDCHADNVPVEKRGSEFHISDGVGCEACHGGSEKWISTHTITPYNAERNFADGMYPTGPLASRTQLCTSCHVGTADKLANHNIMGAGHPRLSFELDTFIARQPEHYDIDQDYLERKGDGRSDYDTPINRMLIGAALHARATAINLSSKLMEHPQGFPEIALFNCHSCHKSLNNPKWQQRPSTVGLRPGSVRLNDGSLILLAAVSGAIDKRLQASIEQNIRNLHAASRESSNSVKAIAETLVQLTQEAEVTFNRTTITKENSQLILNELAQFGANGEYQDYTAAEQAIMAMMAINQQYPGSEQLEAVIGKAFGLTGNDERYQPQRLKALLQQYLKSIK